MYLSKDSMWRRIWKILQNFLGTKQGLSHHCHHGAATYLRTWNGSRFSCSCMHGRLFGRYPLLISHTQPNERRRRRGQWPCQSMSVLTGRIGPWHWVGFNTNKQRCVCCPRKGERSAKRLVLWWSLPTTPRLASSPPLLCSQVISNHELR
jgi:hypothetical protein